MQRERTRRHGTYVPGVAAATLAVLLGLLVLIVSMRMDAFAAVSGEDDIRTAVPEESAAPAEYEADPAIGIPDPEGAPSVLPETGDGEDALPEDDIPEEAPEGPVDVPAEEPPALPTGFVPSSFHAWEEIPMPEYMQYVLYVESKARDIPFGIAVALVDVESSFDPFALNEDTLCYGYTQLNPEYWPADLAPDDNLRQGMAVLEENLLKYGNMDAALTAYNAGHDNGTRWYATEIYNAACYWSATLGL